jgi:hypothetical protein
MGVSWQTPTAVQTSALDEIRSLKALLATAMSLSDASTWLRTPNGALKGARPLDVFFDEGLDAVMPAVLAYQTPDRLRS